MDWSSVEGQQRVTETGWSARTDACRELSVLVGIASSKEESRIYKVAFAATWGDKRASAEDCIYAGLMALARDRGLAH
ncbi:hypothetical protein [Burkholderia ambifaria]|uniref:hypothetical protein n=1 Tax=Burkholderia ambifaria TaxID=152480 RepID=UPI001588D47B|nr:hypothetical protein [Burkholderia ambifaria]